MLEIILKLFWTVGSIAILQFKRFIVNEKKMYYLH